MIRRTAYRVLGFLERKFGEPCSECRTLTLSTLKLYGPSGTFRYPLCRPCHEKEPTR